MTKSSPCEVKAVADIATKLDTNKLDWTLLPFDSLEEVVKVLNFGAAKYNEEGRGPDTWNWAKGKGLGKWRVLAAVFRHVTAYARGENLDPESGISHLAHATCGLLFLLHYHKHPERFLEQDRK